MSASNSAGIQTLLDAEKDAQKIVQKAREYRTQRVKAARNEAQKEIDEYKDQKEEEFKAFEDKHSSGNKQMEEEANKDTDKKLEEIKGVGKDKGDQVVQDLLNAVLNPKPEPPSKAS